MDVRLVLERRGRTGLEVQFTVVFLLKVWGGGGSYRGMEIWWLLSATLLAAGGVVWTWVGLKKGTGNYAFWWMVGAFVFQLIFLNVRGELPGKCPLSDAGEVCVFLAWSLTLFYLVTGPAYRVSLLGMFTAPVVVVFQLVAMVPGLLEKEVVRVTEVNAWGEAHAAFSVLSYGALCLAAVAGVMFLILNRRLKAHEFGGGLMKGMPSVRLLVTSMRRLAVLGWGILTVGVVTGFMMEGGEWSRHLTVALAVWLAYAVVMGWSFFRGMPPRWLAWCLVGLFVVSLFVFGKI